MTATLSCCPACQSSHAPADTVCGTCGLVFASHQSSASAPVAMAFQPRTLNYTQIQLGQQLSHGRYTVQRPLSSGGMGAILLAIDHEAFDRTVVVKALLDYFDPADPQQVQEARDRFVQEARTLATLRHPAIPQIYTYFQDGAQNYIVMEYIEGQDLEQGLTHSDDATGTRISGCAAPREVVLRWGVALCRILDYLANRKPHPVVHHDIKPANLILDANSGDIRLVDFGTARARLVAQRGGVGLHQSSVYGTAGYAAPEQYAGKSEPRSDVYALAATLYHLLTDDDPRNHPFAFPRLLQLGALGEVLSRALQHDVQQRPSAAVLQRHMEALLSLADTHVIEAPDGTDIRDEQALMAWCEAHWMLACSWLYGKLPDQIELRWGQTQLAHQLRAFTTHYPAAPGQALDAMLAMLDPQGFGTAHPQLTTTASKIDFGLLTPASFTYQTTVTVHNIGRRYVQADLTVPAWVRASGKTVAVSPGEQATLQFSPWYEFATRGILRDQIVLRQSRMHKVEIEARAFTSRWRLFLRYHGKKLAIGLVLGTVIFSCCGGGQAVTTISTRAMQDHADGQMYETGVAAMDRGDWQGATLAFTHLNHPYHDSIERESESYYQLGVAAIQRGEWSEARAAFLHANDYKDAQQLLAQMVARENTAAGLRFRVEHDSPVFQMSWSPDGKILATASDDGSIHLWQTHDGKLLHIIQDDNGSVATLRFSQDSQTLIASYTYGVTGTWHVSDGVQVSTRATSGVSISSDGRMSATIANNIIWLWDVSNGTLLRKLHPKGEDIKQIVFSPDGQTLLASSIRQTEIWRISDGTRVGVQYMPVSEPYVLAFMADGKIQVIGVLDQGIGIAQDWAVVRVISQHDVSISHIAQSPDGQVLAASYQDDIVRLWRVSDGTLLKTLPQQDQTIESLAFSPDGHFLATGSRDGIISVWDVQTTP